MLTRNIVPRLQAVAAFQRKNHFLLVTPLTRAGTGKTYAAAFALRNINPSKVLFLVHREQIAKQAIKSFKNVFGNSKTLGLLSGTSKEMKELAEKNK